LLDAFREGRDVYCEFASDLYQRPVTPEDKLRRFVGKTAILGLGYGCGADKFRHMLFIGQGGVSMKIDTTEAQDIVNHYRALYPSIPRLWRFGNKVIDKILEPNDTHAPTRSHIPVTYGEEKVFLPNGMYLYYPGLKREKNAEGNDETLYKNAYGGWAKLYGAKFIENASQALARIVITDIALRIYADTGVHPFLSTHDSLDYCVSENEVELWHGLLEREFAVVPTWAQAREGTPRKVMGQMVVEQTSALPLASEGGWGKNLLEAERAVND
jgi:DNA polymerase